MKRRTWLGLIAVAVAVPAAGAALFTVARAHGHGGFGMHGPLMKRMVSAALDEAIDQAKVTAEQRTAIHAARDRAFAAVDAHRSDRRAHREQALALFEADRIDPVRLQAQMEQRHQAMHSAIAQAIVEVHDTLTPEQRRIVAQYVRTHGPGGMH